MNVGDLVRILKRPWDTVALTSPNYDDQNGMVLAVTVVSISPGGRIRAGKWWYQEGDYEPFKWKFGDKFTINNFEDAGTYEVIDVINTPLLTEKVTFLNRVGIVRDWLTSGIKFVQPVGTSAAPPIPVKPLRVINKAKENHGHST